MLNNLKNLMQLALYLKQDGVFMDGNFDKLINKSVKPKAGYNHFCVGLDYKDYLCFYIRNEQFNDYPSRFNGPSKMNSDNSHEEEWVAYDKQRKKIYSRTDIENYLKESIKDLQKKNQYAK